MPPKSTSPSKTTTKSKSASKPKDDKLPPGGKDIRSFFGSGGNSGGGGGGGGSGGSSTKTTQTSLKSQPISLLSDDDQPENEGPSSSKQQPPPPSKMAPPNTNGTSIKKRKSTVISSSSDNDDDAPLVKRSSSSTVKGRVSNATNGTSSKIKPKASKKRAIESSDEEEEDLKSKKSTKSKTSRPKKKARKSKGDEDDDFDGDEDEEMGDLDDFVVSDGSSEDEKPKKKKPAPVKKKPTLVKGSKNVGSSNGKGKASEEKNESKRKAKEGGGEEEQPKPKAKWVPKQKTGPVNPGSKEIPEGEDGCLDGLTLVFTGEGESLSRDEAVQLAKRYGARVTTTPSSKTSHVVIGSEPGPSKLKMVEKHKISTLDEDGFLNLIATRSSASASSTFKEKKAKEEQAVREAAEEMERREKEEEKRMEKEAKAKGKGKGKEVEHQSGKKSVVPSEQLWTVKYTPKKIGDICGNKGQVEKLQTWLQNWPKALKSRFKKPGKDGSGSFRSLMISGPPGIGKTSSAHLVAKLEGYNVLELNASDTRSKKLLEALFSDRINNKTLGQMWTGGASASSSSDPNPQSITSRTCLILDEVDGMSSGDRGGVGALAGYIKKSKIPLICIANDAKQPKMKPLMNVCFGLAFSKPTTEKVRSRMMSIAYKENIKLDGKTIDQLIEGANSDIRQVINMLSTYKLTSQTMNFDEGKALAKMNEKANMLQTPFTLCNSLFAPGQFAPNNHQTLDEKMGLFWADYYSMPLFVQENYLKHRFARSSKQQGQDQSLKNTELMSRAADALSDGDLVDKMIHGSTQHWSLLPTHGVFSCIRPAYHCYGPNISWKDSNTFPAWFGQNSRQTKLIRMLGEVQIRMRLKVSGDKREIRENYLPTLLPKLVKPLVDEGNDGIEEVISTMDEYFISKDEWDAIVELGLGENNMNDLLRKIPSNVKAAFTRTYNSSNHPIPFYKASESGNVPKKLSPQTVPDVEEAADLDFEEDDTIEDDSGSGGGKDSKSDDDTKMKKHKLITEKKPAGSASGTRKSKPKGGKKASTSKK